MKVRVPGVWVPVFVFAAAVPTFAHHGFGVEFDATKCRDVKGTLTGLKWENPHAYVDVAEKGVDGKEVTWHLEMVTPNALKRNGTTREDFEANMGKPIAARMCPTRTVDYRGAATYLQLIDGEVRIVGQLVERRAPEDRHF